MCMERILKVKEEAERNLSGKNLTVVDGCFFSVTIRRIKWWPHVGSKERHVAGKINPMEPCPQECLGVVGPSTGQLSRCGLQGHLTTDPDNTREDAEQT